MSIASVPTESLAVPIAPAASKGWARLMATAIAGACTAILLVAAWLSPSPSGLGTHGQLRMPACGWIALFDLPCPTCGMTTAFAHAADGHLLASLHAQPLGSLLALATAMTLWVSLFVAVTGWRGAVIFTRLLTTKTAWILSLLVMAAWLYKIVSYKGWL